MERVLVSDDRSGPGLRNGAGKRSTCHVLLNGYFLHVVRQRRSTDFKRHVRELVPAVSTRGVCQPVSRTHTIASMYPLYFAVSGVGPGLRDGQPSRTYFPTLFIRTWHDSGAQLILRD